MIPKYEIEKNIIIPGMDESLSIIHEIQKSVMDQVIQARDNQVIEALKDHGYIFENKQDLEQFAKTRCTLLKFANKTYQLAIDGKIILEWYDTYRFDYSDGKYTVILGERP